MYGHHESGGELTELRKDARYTRAHRVAGVAGGVVLGACYCVNNTVSIGSDPYFPHEIRTVVKDELGL